uniref:Uncharacterized protein n=1 Tax=viral metagenome TaxID=1070528 RepID=A0A6C0JFY9_9ZZZZ
MLNEKLLDLLPLEVIVNEIIPFTYRPQPAKLLVDIRSFSNDFSTVDNGYLYDLNYDVLIYDLLCFCNQTRVPSYNMREQFGNLLKRSYMLRDCGYSELNNLVFLIFHRNVILYPLRKVRFLWGLLRPKERTTFINKFLLNNFYS